MAEPYYLTTAIHYPNGKPHIGHAYETIAADVVARFQRLRGREVRFQTGTDEHGLKMAQKARDLGKTPRDLADEMSGYFKDLFDVLNISYDRFIRTTDVDHHRASQAIWQAMEAKGDLYLDRYEGWYSVRDEAYYDEKELVEGEGDEKLSPQGTPVEWTEEETWFFRLSRYAEPLLELLNTPGFLEPVSRRNEMVAFIERGLQDLSVSRTSFDWGVKVPGSDGHVMYVWVDALTNYITGLGYPDGGQMWDKFWPADLHLIGKDIVRFHTIYWPAFLLSADLPLPKKVFGHGFLLNRGVKESKSAGNVTDPMELAERFGVDALRYFLMAEVTFGQDGSYSAEALVNKVNAELANSFGNLAQRTLSMIAKNMEGKLEHFTTESADKALLDTVTEACTTTLPREFENLNFSVGIEAWLRAVYACNAYVDEQAPWALKKTDPERMKVVLQTLFIAIRDLAIAIQPVVPEKAAAVLDQLGVADANRSYADLGDAEWFGALVAAGHAIDKPTPVFPRLELPEAEPA
ncbi:methionine--tRNA ligase [Qipengyuania flava]|uniref:methionine--tRNA ligase n=1 Tax=Qipengyuania flava TaxID=192812 RepID=UPI001C581E3B|nr:methionine--tRNA ligase [Qipengyuania flava]MBW3168416.1 methionine--tRNA ligase [Qipengyuania flava]MBY5965654.1 methionine--tRNA ligase [Qipengyuania flava]MBY6011978.1 methionine--tRNA ligase [Qipengyuania flava]MBY6026420.1 methionine--tRNA ligase [Qipengyuania flava]